MSPIVIEDVISIGAHTIVDNVIANNPALERFLQCPFDAKGEFTAVSSAAGLQVALDYAAHNVVGDSDLRVDTEFEKIFDTLNDNFYPRLGDLLTLKANNTTGGAISLNYRIVLHPLDGMERGADTIVTQRGPVAIANDGVPVQLLKGTKYERPPLPSYMAIHMTADEPGMTRELYVNMLNIAPPSAVSSKNRIPLDPQDQTIEGVEVGKNELCELSVVQSSDDSMNVFWRQTLQTLAAS